MSTETLTINIEKELKTELKIIALKQNTTVTDILLTFIQDFVNENKTTITKFFISNTL